MRLKFLGTVVMSFKTFDDLLLKILLTHFPVLVTQHLCER